MVLSKNEASCVYAALILKDEGIEITSEKLQQLLKAADLEIEGIWPTIFAKALKGKDLDSLLFSVGSGPAVAGGAPAAAASGGAQQKVEEVKEEAKEESDDDMGFGLFD